MLNMDAQHNDKTASEVVITQSDILFECPSCDKSMVIDESATGNGRRMPTVPNEGDRAVQTIPGR